jgi:hypothetical protein
MSPGLVRFGNHAMAMGGFPSWEMDLSGLDLVEGTGTDGGMENGWEGVMGDVDWVSLNILSRAVLSKYHVTDEVGKNMIDAYCVNREGDFVPQQPLETGTGKSTPGGSAQQLVDGASLNPNSVYSTPYTRSPVSSTPALMNPLRPGGMGSPPPQQKTTAWRSYGYSVGDLMNP